MVGPTYSTHGELAPFLIKYRDLFGLYDDDVLEKQQDEARQVPVMVTKLGGAFKASSYSQPRASFSQCFAIAPDAELLPVSITSHSRGVCELVTGTKADCIMEGGDWFFHGNERGLGARPCNVRRRKAVRISRVQQRDPSHTSKTSLPPLNGYDFASLDQLLDDLTEQVGACSTHVGPGTRASLRPLPRIVSERLTKLHVYLTATVPDILPPAFLLRPRWRSLARIFPAIRTSLDPLGSNPSDGVDRKEAHFRALRAIRLRVPNDKFHLVFSLMALITAQSAVSKLHDLLSSSIVHQPPASSQSYLRPRASPPPTFTHHISRKARVILGLPTLPDTALELCSTSSSDARSTSSSSATSICSLVTTASSLSSPITSASGDLAASELIRQKKQDSLAGQIVSQQNLGLLWRKQLVALLRAELDCMVITFAKVVGIRPLLVKKVMVAKGFLPPA